MPKLTKGAALDQIKTSYEVESMINEDKLDQLLANPDFVSDLLTVDDDPKFKELLYSLHDAAKEVLNA